MNKTVAVIGGGAAGFFAAVNLARLRQNLQVIIFEKSRQVLSKVRISGGGRCNVTHHCFDPEILSMAYPRGSRKLRWAFEQFQAKDTVSWFRERGVELKTENDGRIFPVTDDSSAIINCLKTEAAKYNVEIRKKTRVEAISPTSNSNSNYKLLIRDGSPLLCDAAVIAPGGFNRDSAYHWLSDLGHSIIKPVPSLFTFNFRDKIFQDLGGISVENASISIDGTSFEYIGAVLITHWGLSGPAVLKTSAWAARYLYEQEYRFTISINWIHPKTEQQVRKILGQLRQSNARKMSGKQDAFAIPGRLWKRLLKQADISAKKRWAELSNRHIHDLTQQLTGCRHTIQGKTTYKEEFVTSGGIPLKEVHMESMESKICPGLYFAGEVLNVDGITGGFNFQSAWTTGWIAARDLANR